MRGFSAKLWREQDCSYALAPFTAEKDSIHSKGSARSNLIEREKLQRIITQDSRWSHSGSQTSSRRIIRMLSRRASALCFEQNNISSPVSQLILRTSSLVFKGRETNVPCANTWAADYPLPPKEDKTEILRVVVRESMAADLLDQLISDIVAVTERLMVTEVGDLTAFQTGPTSIERHRGTGHKRTARSKSPKSRAVHSHVC